MNKTIGSSRKCKQGKNPFKNALIEGDNDSIDIVTFKEVTIDILGGPVKKIVEVPLRPIADSQGPSSQPQQPSSQPQVFPSSQIDDFDAVGLHLDDDHPMQGSFKNKVV